MIAFAAAISRLLSTPSVDPGLVAEAFDAILSGEWTSIQVGAFATAVRARGETAPVLTAAAKALRAHMKPVDHGLPLVADTCGTGGDGAHTLNVSTAAAIVVAACGVPLAKHGNRSISSQCGSADVIEALGLPVDLEVARHATLLRDVGITFLFAPAHHPALRHAAQARRELGIRTLFNALGPVANPARATHQVIGVYDDALRPMLAQVLLELGCTGAWVVHSEDGLDELSPAAPTRVSEVSAGAIHERVVTPADFELPTASLLSLRGGDAAENARSIETIITTDTHPAATAVLMGAAATLWVCGRARALPEATQVAREAVRSGSARDLLERWRRAAASS